MNIPKSAEPFWMKQVKKKNDDVMEERKYDKVQQSSNMCSSAHDTNRVQFFGSDAVKWSVQIQWIA